MLFILDFSNLLLLLLLNLLEPIFENVSSSFRLLLRFRVDALGFLELLLKFLL
jgi:hypothetical protein